MTTTPIAHNPLADLLPEPAHADSWRWGAVTGINPVKVLLDGDTAPLLESPDTLTPVVVGDRVRVHICNRRATIIGVAGGAPENSLWIAGRWYAASGVQPMPEYSWTYQGNNWYVTTLYMPCPYTPPAGYGFYYQMLDGNGFTIITNGNLTTDGITKVRLMNFFAQQPKITKMGWQLAKQT